jgi:hypothetical protein
MCAALLRIVAYAPTNDYPSSEKDNFYSELQEAINGTVSRDSVLIGGDLMPKSAVHPQKTSRFTPIFLCSFPSCNRPEVAAQVRCAALAS